MNDLIAEGRARLAAGDADAARATFESAFASAAVVERARVAERIATAYQKAARPEDALAWHARVAALAPADAEPRHAAALLHYELGRVGRAAAAWREALALEPSHESARSFLAGALEALGDLEGAAALCAALAAQRPSLASYAERAARLAREAETARGRRLLGKDVALVARAGFVHGALADAGTAPGLSAWRGPFGELEARLAPDGRVRELRFFYKDLAASQGRLDLVYEGRESIGDGRTRRLDEVTSSGTLLLAAALGVDHVPARRLLDWLVEAGPTGAGANGCRVGWITRVAADGREEHGLYAAEQDA